MSEQDNPAIEKNRAKSKYKKRNPRTILKKSGQIPANAETGSVYASFGQSFLVKSDEASDEKFENLIECSIAGAFLRGDMETSIIAVGDNVYFIRDQEKKNDLFQSGTIIQIIERKSWFSRLSASYQPIEHVIAGNIDIIIIMVSAEHPHYNTKLIDRMLVAAQIGNTLPIIIVNKIDLVDEESKEIIYQDFNIYKELKIPVFFTSILNDFAERDLILSGIYNKNSLIVGQSGTGKSSFLNAVLLKNYQFIKEISEKTNKGKHTTSSVNRFPIEFEISKESIDKWNILYSDNNYTSNNDKKGTIIDSPGIREFGIWGIEKEELCLYFHDFDEYYDKCKFMPCTHTHEPNCAIIQAVEDKKILLERYESYINIYESI